MVKVVLRRTPWFDMEYTPETLNQPPLSERKTPLLASAPRLLLGVTASVAAIKVFPLISALFARISVRCSFLLCIALASINNHSLLQRPANQSSIRLSKSLLSCPTTPSTLPKSQTSLTTLLLPLNAHPHPHPHPHQITPG